MVRINLLRRLVPSTGRYKGHHKRDAFGRVLSRAEESRKHRQKYREKHKLWNKITRTSAAGLQAHKKYNESEKGQRRNAAGNFQRKYGKTLDEKQAKHDQQCGLCGVCGKPLPVTLNECHWDHHHKSGKMRDILHPRCNIAVGFIESELLQPALDYLKRHSDV